jgi:hypothetical protein
MYSKIWWRDSPTSAVGGVPGRGSRPYRNIRLETSSFFFIYVLVVFLREQA